MDLQLENKIVIITGGTGGIGEEICKSFLDEKAVIIPLFRGDLKKLDDLFDWVEKNKIGHDRIFPVEADICDSVSIDKSVKLILKKYGRIDVLVNCAGMTKEFPFLLTEEEEIDQIMKVNFLSMTMLSKAVLKNMIKNKTGAIINISSVLGSRFGRGTVIYSASKAAVERFSSALAIEVGRKGVRVNVVSPGVIETKMTSGLIYHAEKSLLQETPLARFGKPGDIANAVLFLASEKTASYITGQRIIVDGGLSI